MRKIAAAFALAATLGGGALVAHQTTQPAGSSWAGNSWTRTTPTTRWW